MLFAETSILGFRVATGQGGVFTHQFSYSLSSSTISTEPVESNLWRRAAIGPECVKTPSQTLAMISEDFVERIAREAFHPGEIDEKKLAIPRSSLSVVSDLLGSFRLNFLIMMAVTPAT